MGVIECEAFKASGCLPANVLHKVFLQLWARSYMEGDSYKTYEGMYCVQLTSELASASINHSKQTMPGNVQSLLHLFSFPHRPPYQNMIFYHCWNVRSHFQGTIRQSTSSGNCVMFLIWSLINMTAYAVLKNISLMTTSGQNFWLSKISARCWSHLWQLLSPGPWWPLIGVAARGEVLRICTKTIDHLHKVLWKGILSRLYFLGLCQKKIPEQSMKMCVCVCACVR